MKLLSKYLPIFFLLSLVAVLLLATACSPSEAEKLNKEGNDAFAEQAFQEALVAYQTAQIKEPELAEPYYNAANALYRQGAYADALKQMHLALSFADEESLAQAGFYNLGNSSYNQQDLQTAVASYTESLLLNPDDQDAKYNLELALQQLEQQQQEQEQEQEQQQEEQQQEESEDSESEEQEQEADSGESEQEQSEEGQDEEQESESEQEQSEEEADSGESGEEEQKGQESEQQGEQEQDEQQEQGEGQPQDGQPDEEQEGQLNELPQPGQRMTEEQAEQLLAAIARDGQTLQEKLGQIFAVPWRPPVQDW